ncbi:MAG TPA: hypothetical protein DCQ06_13010 [Myxococcales bacterium]|nr:hypothetical protein [Myxococcales bacterium]HAN32509.1 hypothetical protein [Myxococcales bacterium]|tara:strand:- start:223 stop:480 length:258 start_codon:yes stop_codon:yes gene_type:complete
MVLLNSIDASELAYQEKLAASGLPVFQDTEAVKAWVSMDGSKDDFFIYDSKGKLAHYLEFGGQTDTNLGSTSGYDAVKKLIVATQ